MTLKVISKEAKFKYGTPISIQMLKYIIYGLIFFIALVINTALPYLNNEQLIESLFSHPVLQAIIGFINTNSFVIAVITKLILSIQVLLAIVLYPYKYINNKKRKILQRIYKNLFNDNIRNHRVTLFREVGYPRAFWRYICCLCFHFFRRQYFSRFLLHLKHPPIPGNNYLIVDTRCGSFKVSRTMFKVEENLVGNCEGIVGVMRFEKGICIQMADLPDITKINLDNPNEEESKLISEYMVKGNIKDFDMLKRLHVRARHFLGSVIFKTTGEPWGMLLVDSVANANPFNQGIVAKFKVYSETLTDLF
jgi:hypothetical protein